MTKPSSSAYVNPAHSLANGLLCAVPFIEGTGSTARDFADPSRAVPVGAWFTVGGVTFARTGSRLRTRYPIFASALPPVFSVLTRVRTDDPAGGNQSIVDVYPSDDSYTQFSLRVQAATSNVRIDWVNNFSLFTGTATIAANTVYDVALTWDQTTLTSYVNGSVDATGTPANTSFRSLYATMSGPKDGGSAPNCCGEFFYLYDRCLTSAEVASVASSPYQMFSEPGGTTGTAVAGPRGIMTGGRL